MKPDFTTLNRHRIRSGPMGSGDDAGRNGAFQFRRGKVDFIVICSDGSETPEGLAHWEHVSARCRGLDLKERCPTWEEMCFLKSLFWEPTECVVQYHPPESEYVNNHHAVLHLWKPVDVEMLAPPSILVGIKEIGTLK
jgi:hypothetical protein